MCAASDLPDGSDYIAGAIYESGGKSTLIFWELNGVVLSRDLQDNFTAEWNTQTIASVLRPYVLENRISTVRSFSLRTSIQSDLSSTDARSSPSTTKASPHTRTTSPSPKVSRISSVPSPPRRARASSPSSPSPCVPNTSGPSRPSLLNSRSCSRARAGRRSQCQVGMGTCARCRR